MKVIKRDVLSRHGYALTVYQVLYETDTLFQTLIVKYTLPLPPKCVNLH